MNYKIPQQKPPAATGTLTGTIRSVNKVTANGES
jgi:hypothetical protein